jgi:DNA-binding NarL/FixJ family response regulator
MKAFGSVARPYWEVDAVDAQAAPGACVTRASRERFGRTPSVAGGVNGAVVPAPAPGLTLDTQDTVRVLIVDDCTLFRNNLAEALADNGATVSVGWDLPTLITSMHDPRLDVILLNLATRDSTNLVGAAMKTNPGARVIVLGVSEQDEATIVACAEAGVAGYHTRTQSFEDLLVLIGKVAVGESHCSPRVSAVLLRRLSALALERKPASKELVLTSREAQILEMIKLGMSNRDIAAQLCIALHTVKNHVHSVLGKLGVSTRAQAAAVSSTFQYVGSIARN